MVPRVFGHGHEYGVTRVPCGPVITIVGPLVIIGQGRRWELLGVGLLVTHPFNSRLRDSPRNAELEAKVKRRERLCRGKNGRNCHGLCAFLSSCKIFSMDIFGHWQEQLIFNRFQGLLGLASRT